MSAPAMRQPIARPADAPEERPEPLLEGVLLAEASLVEEADGEVVVGMLVVGAVDPAEDCTALVLPAEVEVGRAVPIATVLLVAGEEDFV